MHIGHVILVIYALGFIGFIVGIIYLIFHRVRAKKKETFEKRNN